MIKTFEDLKEISEVYGRISSPEFLKTKLGYAFKRFYEKSMTPIFTDFNDLLQDIRIDNALTNKDTGEILYQPDARNFKYTPEALKIVLNKIKEFTREWDKKEFEVKPFICNEIPSIIEFTEEEKVLLEGVILNSKPTQAE